MVFFCYLSCSPDGGLRVPPRRDLEPVQSSHQNNGGGVDTHTQPIVLLFLIPTMPALTTSILNFYAYVYQIRCHRCTQLSVHILTRRRDGTVLSKYRWILRRARRSVYNAVVCNICFDEIQDTTYAHRRNARIKLGNVYKSM